MSDFDYPMLDPFEMVAASGLARAAAPKLRHVLVITQDDGDERDTEVEHDPGCPMEDSINGPDGIPIRFYTCAVGIEITNCGYESLDPSLGSLPPGRYEIEHWSRSYSGGPWGSGEWDCGLVVLNPPPSEEPSF